MLRESVIMSRDNIFANKMRSFLTVLGIIIGVAAIIALVTVVENATDEMMSQFTQMGTGKVNVSITGTMLKRGLNESDLAEIEAQEYVSGVSPSVTTTATVKRGDTWVDEVDVQGYGAAYFTRNPDLINVGRAINILDTQNRTQVCLIDQKIADTLFFGENPMDQTLQVRGYEYTVIGILTEDETVDLMSQIAGSGDSGKLIVPYTAAMRLSGTAHVNSLELYVSDTQYTEQAIENVERVLDAAFNYKDDAYRVINMQSLLDMMNTVQGMMTSMLAGIASIALLVGGIGIMNMMLTSVTERTVEIGLKKAIGAEPGQIQIQFLIESFLLSMIGGLTGVGLGLALSAVMCSVMGTRFTVSYGAIGLGVGFSAAVGIIFGWSPARKARRLSPIDALRRM